MPCRNAGPYLKPAIASVLEQPGLLELLIADGGSTDGSLELVQHWSQSDQRIRIVSQHDTGPGDALNKAFGSVRGSLIGWLNADDLYPPEALARAIQALDHHPDWLMVYGEGEEFDDATGVRRPYRTTLPHFGLAGQRVHCGICQPTVVWRRSMGILLGPFNTTICTAFDYDYWLRAFSSFPHRIGYIPHLQGRTRLHSSTITTRQRRLVAIEATQLHWTYFGSATTRHLHNYGLELQQGLAQLSPGQTLSNHLAYLIKQASPFLSPQGKAWLRQTWCPPEEARLAEQHTAELHLQECPSVQLLEIAHPQVALTAPSPPAGPHRRLLAGIEQHWPTNLLLHQDVLLHQRLPHLGTPSGDVQPATPATDSKHWRKCPFGVNLIGHAFNVFGIGEDIRMAARSLSAADVPISVIDVPAFNGTATSDRSLESFLRPGPSGPYAFNLICLHPISHAQWLCQHAIDPQRGRYTIAAWPWETNSWPKPWEPLLTYADELWPASNLIHRALEPLAKKRQLPIHTMPMAVETAPPDCDDPAEARRAARLQFHLPETATLFVFSFDFNSTTIRKNPRAVVEAFQLAFPAHEVHDVALVIKVLPPHPNSPDWQWLQARILEDPRIKLIAAILERADLLALFGCCDAFVSLHRSEGFGRALAEALQLGLAVVATNHGGNTDFCQGPLAHPVPYRSVPIPPQAYPPADESHRWAEPDIEQAAAILRRIAASHHAGEVRNRGAITAYRQQFSPHTVGQRYRQRLEAIWQQA